MGISREQSEQWPGQRFVPAPKPVTGNERFCTAHSTRFNIVLTPEETLAQNLPANMSEWQKAGNVCMKIGKFKGRSLFTIARTFGGVRYLHWLRAQWDAQLEKVGGTRRTWMHERLARFLDDPRLRLGEKA